MSDVEEESAAATSADDCTSMDLACGALCPTVPADVETITVDLPIPTTAGTGEQRCVMFVRWIPDGPWLLYMRTDR